MPLNRRCALLLAALPLAAIVLPAWAARAEEKEKEGAGPPKQVFVALGDFTVNLRDKEGQFGFVVVGITLDVAPQAANQIKEVTPRLKETLTRRLMALADRGALTPGETDTVALKASLADALQKVSADGIKDVLITRLLFG
ncbi:MAG: flagellar basal body-associated FliL family protein [Alphaproteobacteria bacterium]|nr:flagellar basal body-associated FliL family protein [Alphaproteobacteria bacterium]